MTYKLFKRTTVADANYTVLTTDDIIAFTSLTASRTLTLPTPDGKIREFIIKDESNKAATYPIIIDPDGAVTIDTLPSIEITLLLGSVIIYSDGTNYFTKTDISSSHVGQIKINDGNSVKPIITITAPTVDILQPVTYASPLGISSYPTSKWPQNINTPIDADIYDFTNDTFIENAFPGQVNDWRFIIDYSGKSIGSTTGMRIKLSNSLSGFVLEDTRFLPNESASGTIVFSFRTIADAASLPAPFGTGQGYDVEIAADDPITFTFDSITRFSRKTD